MATPEDAADLDVSLSAEALAPIRGEAVAVLARYQAVTRRLSERFSAPVHRSARLC